MVNQAPVGILLAAGSGRRFDPAGGQNKLTALLPSGVAVAVQSAKNLCAALPRVIVVVQNQQLTDPLTALGCTVLVFAGARQGMGASLAFATDYVATRHPEAGSVIVALADMPHIKTSTIKDIVARTMAGSDLVQPRYNDQAGHPVGFSKRHFPALMALTGDTGARQLLGQYGVDYVNVDDPGVIQDIDYLSDLQGL